MSITGDRYEGEFEGHKIELVRNNWVKTLSLLIDGERIAWEMQMLPHDVTLEGEFELKGQRHKIVARSVIKPLYGLPIDSDDSVEIDGKPLALKKTR